MTEQFAEKELPTTPTRKEFMAALIVKLWFACKATDQSLALRFLELAARDNQGEIKWD
jgi:hypothetical protein